MKRKLLGHVGVDAGQLMVCDPCYIDSQWSKKDFADIRVYEHIKTKKKLMYQSSAGYGGKAAKAREKAFKGELFKNYDAITSFKLSMNELITKKQVKEVPVPEKLALIGDFSYAGISETTMAGKHQINYQMGHPGAAVVFQSGLGDGVYPVYGYFEDGRCWKVEIDMGLTPVQKKFLKTMK